MDQKNDSLKSALLEAVSRVLENMAFEEVELADEISVTNLKADGKLWAILPILEPLSGEVILSLSLECARRITENIYGTIEDGKLEKGAHLDALAEILNSIAGRFVHTLIPSNQGFDLGLPKTGKGAIPVTLSKAVTSVSINISGHVIIAIVIGEDFRSFTQP